MEFAIIILENLCISRSKKRYVKLLISLFIGFIIFHFFTINEKSVIISILNNSLNLIGIFIGFTSAILALILSSNNDNLHALKEIPLNVTVFGNSLNLYDDLVISLINLIFLYCYLLLSNFILIISYDDLNKFYLYYYHFNIALLIYSILNFVTILTNFYLTISKK